MEPILSVERDAPGGVVPSDERTTLILRRKAGASTEISRPGEDDGARRFFARGERFRPAAPSPDEDSVSSGGRFRGSLTERRGVLRFALTDPGARRRIALP